MTRPSASGFDGDQSNTWPVDRWLLAVDGVDGSGKSVFARHLVSALARAGVTSVLLPVDDFRRPVDFASAGAAGNRSEADIYYDDYYDLPLIDRCLDAFATGQASVVIPVFDANAHRLQGERVIALAGATVAVVEGVFALRVGHVARHATVIFVRTSFQTARGRILARDTARGRTRTDVEHRIDARYFPAHDRYLRAHDPLARADVVVEHEVLGAPTLARGNSSRLDARISAALDHSLLDIASARPVR